MAIDDHGHREPLPLPSRAYISTPRAPPHPLRTHPSSQPLLVGFLYPTELAAAALEVRPPASISAAVTSPLLSLLPKLLRVVSKQIPIPSSFPPSRTHRRRSLAAGRPPPWMARLDRRSNHPCEHIFRFTIILATCRCFPTQIRGRERIYGQHW
jgi:hypothetical protein